MTNDAPENELWDMSGTQERVAAAMWRSEAMRGAPRSVAARRTPEAFRNKTEDARRKCLNLAAVAIETLIAPSDTDKGDK